MKKYAILTAVACAFALPASADFISYTDTFGPAATDFGDGEVPYDAVLWAEPSSSGFVIDFGGAGSIACAGGACVSCDAEGTCEAQ